MWKSLLWNVAQQSVWLVAFGEQHVIPSKYNLEKNLRNNLFKNNI
jgi:hypothetical protein